MKSSHVVTWAVSAQPVRCSHGPGAAPGARGRILPGPPCAGTHLFEAGVVAHARRRQHVLLDLLEQHGHARCHVRPRHRLLGACARTGRADGARLAAARTVHGSPVRVRRTRRGGRELCLTRVPARQHHGLVLHVLGAQLQAQGQAPAQTHTRQPARQPSSATLAATPLKQQRACSSALTAAPSSCTSTRACSCHCREHGSRGKQGVRNRLPHIAKRPRSTPQAPAPARPGAPRVHGHPDAGRLERHAELVGLVRHGLGHVRRRARLGDGDDHHLHIVGACAPGTHRVLQGGRWRGRASPHALATDTTRQGRPRPWRRKRTGDGATPLPPPQQQRIAPAWAPRGAAARAPCRPSAS